jgi:hypothetical protein
MENNHFNQSSYVIDGKLYNVPKLASWAAGNLRPTLVAIEEIQRNYVASKDLFVDVEEGEEWFNRSMGSDLSFPILLLKKKDGRFDIIDGNHRVWKAWKTGAKEIQAYVFDSSNLPSS